MVMVPALRDASNDPRLRGAPLGLYVWLICQRLDCERFQPLKIEGLAVSLRVKRDTVSRALRLLVEGGYLERRGQPQTGYEYRVYLNRIA